MKFYFAIFWILCRADLANLVNEAALLAGRSNKIVVEKNDFIHAVERSIAVELAFLFLLRTTLVFPYICIPYFPIGVGVLKTNHMGILSYFLKIFIFCKIFIS